MGRDAELVFTSPSVYPVNPELLSSGYQEVTRASSPIHPFTQEEEQRGRKLSEKPIYIYFNAKVTENYLEGLFRL